MASGDPHGTQRIPSLSRIPKELGRERRTCPTCGVTGENIYYLVPRKIAFLYFRNHAQNLHATCLSCAHSTVITGEERDRILSGKATDRGRSSS